MYNSEQLICLIILSILHLNIAHTIQIQYYLFLELDWIIIEKNDKMTYWRPSYHQTGNLPGLTPLEYKFIYLRFKI